MGDGNELRKDQRQRGLECGFDSSLSSAGEDLFECSTEVPGESRVDQRVEHRIHVAGPGDKCENCFLMGESLNNTIIDD